MDIETDATHIFPCPHCGASATRPGRTQPGIRPIPAYDLQQWHEAAETVARTLTLIRESLAEPPEDLDEIVATLEGRAWRLAHTLGDLAGVD